MEFSRLPIELPLGELKKRLLNWAARFPRTFCFDNNQYEAYSGQRYEFLLGVDSTDEFCLRDSTLNGMDAFIEAQKGEYIFCAFSYDLKNAVEQLESRNPDPLDFPKALLVKARYVLFIRDGYLWINRRAGEAMRLMDQVLDTEPAKSPTGNPLPELKAVMPESEYLEKVAEIRKRIARGDFYEMNFCQAFEAEAEIDPLEIFHWLNQASAAPFSAFVKDGGNYLLSASPERFLEKRGSTLRSFPMKGTGPRSTDPDEDLELRERLQNNIKERAENVMIVDLVRNDLARICRTGSIEVEALYDIYGFRQVNQMVSIVQGELEAGHSFTDILRACFPMGSMTGAPKIEVMKCIDELETRSRGWYSGSVGYIDPEGDFDLNVVIRSLCYRKALPLLSLQLGGAITWDSVPELEYEECLLKGKLFLG